MDVSLEVYYRLNYPSIQLSNDEVRIVDDGFFPSDDGCMMVLRVVLFSCLFVSEFEKRNFITFGREYTYIFSLESVCV